MNIRQTLFWILLGAGMILLILVGILFGLFGTETGSRWVFDNIRSQVPGSLTVETTQGNFLSNFQINSLRYKNETFTVTIDEVSLSWSPLVLLRGTFEISHLKLRNTAIRLPKSNEPTQSTDLPEISVPIAVHLQNLDVVNTRLSREGDTENQRLRSLTGRILVDTHRIHFRPLSLETDEIQTTVRGWFDPREYYTHDLTATGSYRGFGPYQLIEVNLQLKGDLRKSRLTLKTERPETTEGTFTLRDPLDDFQWSGNLNFQKVDPRRYVEDSPVGSVRGTLSGTGTLNSVRLNGSLQTGRSEMETLNLRVDGQRSDEGFRIDELGISVRSPSHQPQLDVTLDGKYRTSTNYYSVQGKWKNLTFPPFQKIILLSTHGQLKTQGSLNDYSGTTTGRLYNERLGKGQFTSRFQGDSTSLRVSGFRTSTKQGTLRGQGQIRWSPYPEWNLSLEGSEWAASLLREDMEGAISFRSKLEGSYRDDRLQSRLSLIELEGSFQGEPVTARGNLTVDGSNYTLEPLKISSRGGRLFVQGEIGEQWDLNGNLKLTDLSRWDLGLNGSGSMELSVQGSRSQPNIRYSSELRNLRRGAYGADQLRARLNLHLNPAKSSSVSLVSRKVQLGDSRLRNVRLEGHGPLTNHNIQFESHSDRNIIGGNLEGGLDDRTWTGQLKNLHLRSDRFGNWTQKLPSRIVLSPRLGNLNEICLGSDGSTVCSTLQGGSQGWSGNIRVDNLPASRFNPLLPENLRAEGKINLNASGQYSDTDSTQLAGHLTLNHGFLKYFFDQNKPAETIPFRSSKIDFSVDHRNLSVQVDSDFSEFGHVSGKIRVDTPFPMDSLPERNFSGQIDGAIREMSFLHFWTDAAHWEQGGFKIDVSGSGPLNNPRIQGNVRLDTGRVRLADPAITVDNVTGELRADGSTLNYEVHGESGGGTLAVRGTASRSRNHRWGTRLRVTGRQFRTVHTKNLKITASPVLDISLEPPSVVLRGRVNLPYINLKQLTDLSQNVISTSQDVRYVDSTQTDDETPISGKQWNFDGLVTVTLGDSVYIQEGGFTGQLGGSITLTEKPNQPTLTRGDLEIIDGSYQAYGRTLNIRSGRIIFSQTPPENPRLEIEAVRKLREVVVGVRVRGTAEQPEVTLFSEPPMAESDIISYIVLGRPASGATGDRRQLLLQAATAAGFQGGNQLISTLEERLGLETLQLQTEGNLEEGSLTIGKYLSPRLYVSYGMGLFDNENQITFRYEFDNNWTLEAQGGEHTSADLFYRLNS